MNYAFAMLCTCKAVKTKQSQIENLTIRLQVATSVKANKWLVQDDFMSLFCSMSKLIIFVFQLY